MNTTSVKQLFCIDRANISFPLDLYFCDIVEYIFDENLQFDCHRQYIILTLRYAQSKAGDTKYIGLSLSLFYKPFLLEWQKHVTYQKCIQHLDDVII